MINCKRARDLCDLELFFREEATTGFEPVIKVLQTYALPLGYVAVKLLYFILKIKVSQVWGDPKRPLKRYLIEYDP